MAYFDQEVEVGGQEHISIKAEPKADLILLQQAQIEATVLLLAEDLLASIPASDHMIEGTRKMNSGLSGHDYWIAESASGVK
jgi:hypothetical protein